MEREVSVRVLGVPPKIKIYGSFIVGLLVGVLYISLFIHILEADTAAIDPNADGTVTATAVSCGGGGRYDCLDDGVATSSTPSTGSDYLNFALGNIDNYQMETVSDVNTATEVRVNLFHISVSSNVRFDISLWDSAETTQYGSTVSFPVRTSARWDTATFSGLSLSQAQLDGLRVRLSCVRQSGGQPQGCRAFSMYADVVYAPLIEVTVGQTGTQQNIGLGATNAHIGGAFTITENVSSRNVTSITIEENGTIDAQNDLDNIRLYYDLDTSLPYDCASESYSGTESQFGATNTDGFSGADGTSTFTGSVGISTTATMCVYVVVDVGPGATSGETIEVEINDPPTDVVASGSADVEPNSPIALSGSTVIQAPNLTQTHYHWRNDNGTESSATSATGGSEDATYDTLGKLSPTRLRLEVSNEGNTTSSATQYRLEYARKITTCSVATGWTDVGAGGGDWDMYDSGNLTNAADTTDISEATGGVTNENTTFLTPNGGVRDTTSQTGNITLTSSQFVELEYSIEATSNATEGYTYCFRVTDAGTEIDTYSTYPEATILADVTTAAVDAQQATVDIPTSNAYLGGAFSFVDNIAGDTTITSITITASGTVDYQNDIDNIRLLYDLDTSNPYDCASESYGGGESQFGATDTDGFSATGTSTFTGSRIINPTQTLCLYVVYDVTSGVSNDETFEVRIENAADDVLISSGTVAPSALVDISGSTMFVTDTTSQVHYHWRNDNGTESGATSATGGSEDTTLENLRPDVPTRLRIGVANEGSSTTPAYQYRLESALRISSCAAATGWVDVGAAGGEFDMYDSPNITNGGNTTNIAVANGGVTDEGDTFLSSNGGLRDTTSQTGNITLTGKQFVDLEYALTASTSAVEGATYCFRVTNAGTPIDSYAEYPKVSIKPKTDFFIQRGVTTMTGTSATITAGVDYVAPASSASAFIRITNTNNTGAGSSSGNADDVTAYVSNPSNITSSITFTRPSTATGNTRIAWEIIEYVGAPAGDNEIIVRQQSTATYGSGNTTVTTGTVSGVSDDNDIAVFITGQLNPDTTTNYPYGNSTAAWNGGADTATFTRGASGNTAGVSYAVVEFTGENWAVQRAEHNYTAAGSTETESITAVNSLSRAFLHVQKRMGSGLNNHADFGHRVWLSSIGQVSFELETGASTPGSHYSVAWIVENTQTVGDTMIVTPSNGTQSGGTSPTTLNVDIGTTISDTQDASLFMNNSGNEVGSGGGQNTFPEPLMSARLISTTQYELWIATPDNDTRTWRADVVEWPTAARDIAQNYYRFYVNNDALDPTDPWPSGATDLGENTEVTGLDEPIASGEVMRLRMTLHITSAALIENIEGFKLQYGERSSTCSAISEATWRDLGNIGSTTALWRGYDATPADGTALSTDPPAGGALNISVSDVAGTYEEQNDSALTPFEVAPGEDVEFDWVIQHNGAAEKTSYCFRMIEASGNLFDDYNFYPTMRTAGFGVESQDWIWYDDEQNLTPTTTLAATNTAPIDIDFDNTVVLRTTLNEVNGANGIGAKFKLQFSEYANFSTSTDVAEIGGCTNLSYWCYDDGAGTDNATITAKTLSDANSCVAGVGDGCGSYNESGTSTSSFVHQENAAAEYSFTIRNSGARVNVVYYFRLYDMLNDEVVPLGTGESHPSLVTKGASLISTIEGLSSSTSIEGVTLDIDTTPTTLLFGAVPADTYWEGAHRLFVDTNGTEGYKILMRMEGELQNSFGTTIAPIIGTNSSPTSWSTGCEVSALSCFGYHTSDDTLEGGSTRFSAIDTYARVSTTSLDEIAYSSQPVINEFTDIIYRISRTELQEPGVYEARIIYITVPVF